MLVIRRRTGDGLVIAGNVEIEILEISPTRVKIGISAPDSITILRKEVQLTRQQNINAAHNISSATLSVLAGKLRSK